MRKRIFTFAPGLVLGMGLSLTAVRLAFLWNILPDPGLSHASAYVREVLEIVNANYVDPNAVKYDALARSAIHGMVDSLDPHSEFLESDDNKELEEELDGEFGGIGIQVEMRDHRAIVIAPMPGTPGERAGIQRGDEIVGIDGHPVNEKTLMDDIVKELRGKPKTAVGLTLFRASSQKRIELHLIREVIKVESITAARVLPDGIGYIRLAQFSEHTGDQFDSALDGLIKKGIGSLVIDLRDNPGGIIDAAVEVAEPFFKKGELIVYTQGRSAADREDYRADTEGEPLALPIAVLINSGSASAAEIVTGALKDTGRAVIVGERSFGKGSVQTLFKLKNGEGLRLTTARYYTPSGVSIHEKGIEPQVEVVMTPDEDSKLAMQSDRADLADPKKFKERFGFEPVRDRQLEAACDVLKGVELLDDQKAYAHQPH